ncbi:MAG: ribbon-helix-helix protein, CopG family [Alphaproteobacteria bacterium]|nr:ribbon-helix-helix protein, CopG family [Alphaproteobacteria bacterium]
MKTTSVTINISAELESRLKALAERMEKPVEEVLALALAEYADTWEDHLDTVDALKEGDDRVQVAVNDP